MGYDTIIIGAGPSGLAAGIRLAHHGRRVAVLERHEIWGGLSSFYSLEGRKFDVGLHALTNFVPPRTPGAPLTRILRQLGLAHADLHLREQGYSEILFPDLRLEFTNDIARLESAVERLFPAERDRFRILVDAVRAFEHGIGARDRASGRALLAEHLREPALIEMLLLPLLLYGSAREDDIDRGQLVTLFRAIFLEGLARPAGGIRRVLNLLVKRLKAEGGELRTRSGVARIHLAAGAVCGVELDDGTRLATEHVLSCAGLPETLGLCAGADRRNAATPPAVGRISVLESISVLDRLPAARGHGAATSFFSTQPQPRFRCPADLIEPTLGAVAVPENFGEEEDAAREGTVRLTTLANHDGWSALPSAAYAAAKERCADEAIAAASTFFPDWRPHTVFRDVFTPLTIRRFTGRRGGAIYGSPHKRTDGETGLSGLQICGADQGLVGVVGALYSGILMANRHAVAAR